LGWFARKTIVFTLGFDTLGYQIDIKKESCFSQGLRKKGTKALGWLQNREKSSQSRQIGCGMPSVADRREITACFMAMERT